MSDYHIPVLFHEAIEALAIDPAGVYVDLTFGGGGHSRGILEKLGPNGKLIAFDQDQDARANAEDLKTDNRFLLIPANFRFMEKYLRIHGFKQVDGILADLGISSYQIDEGSRGFSTRFDGPLDMRMNQTADITAAYILNTYPERELHSLLGMYGEVKNAKTLATALVMARAVKPFETITDLKAVLQKFAPRGKESKYMAQVFQAIRIEVNAELEVLKEFLQSVPNVLSETGRLAVITFHSLEDRLVKNYIKTGKFSGDVDKDLFGNELKPLDNVERKPITATEVELEQNKRSRSAKLRVAKLK